MTVSSGVLDAIVAHAQREAPGECCGLLLGRAERIVEAVATHNLSSDPNRFLIDPKDHIDHRRRARDRELDVVGFYHSHPHSPAYPSATDVAQASYRECVHLIVSLQSLPADVRLFRIGDEGFEEIPMTTDSGPRQPGA